MSGASGKGREGICVLECHCENFDVTSEAGGDISGIEDENVPEDPPEDPPEDLKT
jgi:hypothetical protein